MSAARIVLILRGLVAGLVVASTAWLSAGTPAGAALPVTPASCAIPVYDFNDNPIVAADNISERGPPATHDLPTITDDAVDRWLHGAPVRSSGVTPCAATTCDGPARFVQLAQPTTMTGGCAVVADADLSSVQRSDVAANGGRRAAQSCLTNSFSGDTLVLMADGTRKPIKDVKLGDWVMATDPLTGERGPRKVVDLIRHGGLHTMVAVRLADGSTIDATDRHPFWVESRGEWVDAIDLRDGDVVVTADGDRLAVESLGISTQDVRAYNLTVDGLHTYFVGAESVLVHNAGCMSLTDASATKHGQQRLAERGFDATDIAIARPSNLAYEQANGAMAHVAQLDNVYNVVVVGERGVITGMKGLTERELGNLARNCGWSGYP